MDIKKIPTGKNPPGDIYVMVEIPQGSGVKYEVDKHSGAVFVDRFLFTPMTYPAAYGFIPGTLAGDGDPLDALVMVPAAVVPGCVVRARPIGLLDMEDEAGPDLKVICVPVDRIHPQYAAIDDVHDLPVITRKSIEHFFERYKDLEPGKWVKVVGWVDRAGAEAEILRSMEAGAADAAKGD